MTDVPLGVGVLIAGFVALGNAVGQNPSERLQSEVNGLDSVDVE